MKMGNCVTKQHDIAQQLSAECEKAVKLCLSNTSIPQEARASQITTTLDRAAESMLTLLEPAELGILSLLYQKGSEPSGTRYELFGVVSIESAASLNYKQTRELLKMERKAMSTAKIVECINTKKKVTFADIAETVVRLNSFGLVESYPSRTDSITNFFKELTPLGCRVVEISCSDGAQMRQ